MTLTSNLKQHLYIVILCGGGGTRLWPKSVSKTPKQFLNLTGSTTLYEDTIARVIDWVGRDRIKVITNHQYRQDVRELSPQIPTKNIILEPEKKNTALAMGVASSLIYREDPDAVIINLASDHVVVDHQDFLRTIATAAQTAIKYQQIVTIGINPTFPHTGLGYIKSGQELEKLNRLPVFQVDGFTEKPRLTTAQAFLATGKYFWNANLYTWTAKTILDAFRRLDPDLYRHIKPIMDAYGTKTFNTVLKKHYHLARTDQIDTAIAEKSTDLLMIPGDFGWNDIGSWEVVYDLGKKDKNQNLIIKDRTGQQGQAVVYQATGNLIHCHNRVIALADVSNLIIVDTPEALLIVPRRQSQDVKKLVAEIKKKDLIKLT